ncbi:MAG: TetR/AcrR family transcriptional regulator C-terminal domain-containing protein [Ruminococcus sp.]
MKHSVTTLNTKRLIANSLKKIMSKKPFSKITVTEIIKDCGVNRKTFYYHFADIYALLKWMFEEEAVEVVKNFDIYTNPEEAIEFVIDYVRKNEHIISCAYDSIGREEMKNFFSSDFRGIIYGVITKAEKNFEVELDADYKKFLTNFYTEAFSGMLIDWVKDREVMDEKLTVEYVTKTVRSTIEGVMRKEKECQSVADGKTN